MKTELTPDGLSEVLGERIKNWIEQSLTFENGCKREQEEDDMFDTDVAWVFTQKGQRLYDSYLSKATRLFEKYFPDEFNEIEIYTGVIHQ